MNRIHSILALAVIVAANTSPLLAGCPSCPAPCSTPQRNVYFEDTKFYKQSLDNVNIQERDRDEFANPEEQGQQLYNKYNPNPKSNPGSRSGSNKNKSTAYETEITTPNTTTNPRPVREPRYNPFGKDTNSNNNPSDSINRDSPQGPRTVPFQNNMR